MHGPVLRHRAAGRDQRLPGDLAAEHTLPAFALRTAPAEDVDLDLLQVEQVEHLVERLAHAELIIVRPQPLPRRLRGRISSTNLDGFRPPRPSADLARAQDRHTRSRPLVIPT